MRLTQLRGFCSSMKNVSIAADMFLLPSFGYIRENYSIFSGINNANATLQGWGDRGALHALGLVAIRVRL